jgi:hypothetical protein
VTSDSDDRDAKGMRVLGHPAVERDKRRAEPLGDREVDRIGRTKVEVQPPEITAATRMSLGEASSSSVERARQRSNASKILRAASSLIWAVRVTRAITDANSAAAKSLTIRVSSVFAKNVEDRRAKVSSVRKKPAKKLVSR